MWIIWGSCFAVACQSGSDMCDPITLPSSSSIASIYVHMLFQDLPVVAPVSPGRERVVPYPVHTDEDKREGDMTDRGGSDRVDSKMGGVTSKLGGVSNSLPIANAGEDVVIVFPENTVKLYGNRSTDGKVN